MLVWKFPSTLSLRRATDQNWASSSGPLFLSTLSLRRATLAVQLGCKSFLFLSTLSLRRATSNYNGRRYDFGYFYPRSPCGERPISMALLLLLTHFYPRSPCGERRGDGLAVVDVLPISIHALLAESDMIAWSPDRQTRAFLSTLSLRRATYLGAGKPCNVCDFYPRSPCGERQLAARDDSILFVFLSTLSLRRATLTSVVSSAGTTDFYPRSPCGERPYIRVLGRGPF